MQGSCGRSSHLEPSMSSVAASHVRIYRMLESEQESKESAADLVRDAPSHSANTT